MLHWFVNKMPDIAPDIRLPSRYASPSNVCRNKNVRRHYIEILTSMRITLAHCNPNEIAHLFEEQIQSKPSANSKNKHMHTNNPTGPPSAPEQQLLQTQTRSGKASGIRSIVQNIGIAQPTAITNNTNIYCHTSTKLRRTVQYPHTYTNHLSVLPGGVRPDGGGPRVRGGPYDGG